MSSNGNSGSQMVEGSQTVSVEEIRPVLQLRAAESTETRGAQNHSTRPSVRWESDVVDNENMNKKKTKICCIFHPQHEFDPDEEECSPDHHHDQDSSSSSSSSSSSESESEKKMDLNERRQRRIARRRRKMKENKDKSPNAYEIQPDYTHERARRENHH